MAVARAMTVLHATEPATVYLSLQARLHDVTIGDIDRALYEERSLVKQLAMRRTLFVFPRELLSAAWAGPGARVAGQELRKTAKDVVGSGLAPDQPAALAWLEQARAEVLSAMRREGPLTVARAKELVPMIAGKISMSPGTKWGGDVPLAPRVLTWMGARGDIVRGRNAGHWRISRPAWTSMPDWLDEDPPAPLDEPAAYAVLVASWLRTFGPGTEADLVWWLGSTKTVVRRALIDVGGVEVSLGRGRVGWLHPEDADADVAEVEPWAALLPVLDPTTMGWRNREFYLEPDHVPFLFDSNGNGGTTAWWNGRIVGCWVQDAAGVVRVVRCESLPRAASRALGIEADRLTAWLDGTVVGSVYSSLQMKGARLP